MRAIRRLVSSHVWVHGVIGIWLVASALVLLQPCCEAFAASVPHEHRHSHEFALDADPRDGVHYAADTGERHASTAHEHCPPIDARDLNQPLLTAAPPPNHVPKPDVVLVATSLDLTVGAWGSLRPSGVHAVDPIPPNIPIYLQTQRLRH